MYVNNLCVSGERIALLKPPKTGAISYTKNIKINFEEGHLPEASFDCNQDRKLICDRRIPAKLTVTDYKNVQVCNKQLRQIYETVEVEDFEKILKNICTSDAFKNQSRKTPEDILDRIKADEIYQEFFGQHYDRLNNAIINS